MQYYVRNGTDAGGYRHLSRRLQAKGANLEMLERLARADHFGRTTPEALAGDFAAGEIFLREARKYGVERTSNFRLFLKTQISYKSEFCCTCVSSYWQVLIQNLPNLIITIIFLCNVFLTSLQMYMLELI